MTLMGHQISYVIYYQLQSHFTIIFNVLSASLFLKEQTLHSSGMNTSVDKHVRQIVRNFKNSNSSVAGEDPEGANRLFSRCEKRYFVSETV